MAFTVYISELQRLAATTVVVAMAALAAPTAQAGDASKGKKVLLLESFTAHPYVATTEKSFRERAQSYGMDVTVQAAGLDAALQARQADDGIARKFDLIVIQPISEQGVVPVLTRAKQAGIPVIIVNNTPKDGTEDLYVTFVGQDQNEMGRIVGRAVLQALKDSGRDGGKVALITGALQQGLGPRRVAGFKEAVAANPKVAIAAIEDGRWDTATSERLAGQLYARFAATGGLDAVYGMADNQAVAAIKAAEAAGIAVGTGAKQLIVVGGNCQKEGLDAISAGKMYSSVTQIPTDLGRRTADTADEFFAGKTLPKAVLLPVELITKANLAQWRGPCTY
ncbi:MAG: sugar ABC transporter substrate-binding protein [Xanthobacteraceae bacterium]